MTAPCNHCGRCPSCGQPLPAPHPWFHPWAPQPYVGPQTPFYPNTGPFSTPNTAGVNIGDVYRGPIC